MVKLKTHRFEIFFCTLMFQLLYPFIALFLPITPYFLQVASFSLLVFASFNLAMRKIPKMMTITFGGIGLVSHWCSYLFDDQATLQFVRVYATCFFDIILVYILTQNFLMAKSISIKVVIGAMSGYLLIGFLGSGIIEMIEFHHPGSFNITKENEFDFIYYSFISMLTIGYGDIVPISDSAKSVTILISLIGQFYMAIGIASFVGKFMNK